MHPTQNQAGPVAVTPADTLRAAAVYLQRHGWTQGSYYGSPIDDEPWPTACALGAIGVAVYGRVTCPDDQLASGWPAVHTAREALCSYPYLSTTDSTCTEMAALGFWPQPGDWNDRPEQTAETVIASLQAAADEWDRTHGGTE